MKTLKVPNEEELSLLKSVSINDHRKNIRLRALVILKRLKGHTYRKIAKSLKCSKNTVQFWVQSWNNNGIGSILTWKTTKTILKSIKASNVIERLISIKPKTLKFPFTNWSLRTLKAFFKDWLGYKISVSSIRRILKRLKFKYRKVEEKLYIKPPDYDVKKALLTLLKRFKPPTTRLVYIDEKGPVFIRRHSGRIWADKPVIKDKRQKHLGKVMFLGAFDPEDYLFSMSFMSTHNSKGLCESLDVIINRFLVPPYNKLLLVMDNSFLHHSNYTKEFLEKYPQVEKFFLPTYSPELNPIELCFNHYQRELINNGTFYSGLHLILETKKYVEYFNKQRRVVIQM